MIKKASVLLIAVSLTVGCTVPGAISEGYDFSSLSDRSVVLFTTSASALCPEYALAFGSESSAVDHTGVFSAKVAEKGDSPEPVFLQAMNVVPKTWGIRGFFPSIHHEYHHFSTNYFVSVAPGEVVYAGHVELEFSPTCRVATLRVTDQFDVDVPRFADQFTRLEVSAVQRRIFAPSRNPICREGFLGTPCFP